jgi:GTP-binding protein HflX
MPRLRGKGIVLSRLGGGIGTRGPGEKKLEVEKRRIADKIVKLKKDIERVRKHRKVQREKRFKEKISVCSLVGYTNAGKSTLLNSLTDSDQKTSNSLFTTLDPISRMFHLAPHHKIILTDTVGFIYKLPHHLVEAFKATLEELKYAELLIHVVDASSTNCRRLIMAVDTVLKELGLDEKPTILAFNKIDQLPQSQQEKLRPLYPQGIFISALNKINLDLLLEEVNQRFSKGTKQFMVSFPFSCMEVLDYLYQHSEVTKVEYASEQVRAWVRIKDRFIPYLLKKKVVLEEF